MGKFKGIDSIFPTEREAREELQDISSTIELIGKKLLDRLGVTHVYLKLGKDGMLRFTLETDGILSRKYTPAFGYKPVDLTGAGDTMLATINIGRLTTDNLDALDIIGSLASAIAISSMGNKPVKHDYLIQVIRKL